LPWVPAFAGTTIWFGWLALALSACSMFVLTDPYGNTYGDWYNPGSNYRWQLTTCEQAIDDHKVPNAARKGFMRCCMWQHGVPIGDAQSCGAPPTG
jgi:hypothetical protein